MLDHKTIPILIFILASLAAIFFTKSRGAKIIFLTSLYALILFFLSITITNYNIFREIFLLLTIFLSAELFLIFCFDESVKSLINKNSSHKKILIFFLFSLIFFGAVYLTNNIFYKIQKSPPALSILAASEFTTNKIDAQRKLSKSFFVKNSSIIILMILSTTLISLSLRDEHI